MKDSVKQYLKAGNLLLLTILFVSFLQAQTVEKTTTHYDHQHGHIGDTDTTSLLYAFRSGTLHGHFRYFFMATDNRSGLSDYYGQAAGGGIRYETGKFKGFQVAIGGFYIFNIGSSNLTHPDPLTGQANRYEIGLYDVEDPSNKKDIDRLEEFYLKYSHGKGSIILGRQLLNTPFINLQDGRMRPTGVEGIYGEWKAHKKWTVEGGWLYAISPRSTTRWFNVDESMGVYPSGVRADGAKSQYHGNLTSAGAFQLGIHANPGKKLALHGWDLFVENIFNAAMIQADYRLPLKDKQSVLISVMGIRQDILHNGGNNDPALAYATPGSHAWAFSGRAGWSDERWEATLNYTRITADGRYLMPREWGRDPFYTFMPRERNEGFGDVDAVAVMTTYKVPRKGLKAAISAGYYQLPEISDFRLNKYGLPSYYQVNTEIRYQFHGLLKGMDAQLLVAAKKRAGELPSNLKYVINKVDMINYNLVVNYNF